MKLTDEERKKFNKLVTLDKFKKKFSQAKKSSDLLYRKTGCSIRNITKKDLDEYVEKNLSIKNDDIVTIYKDVINTSISSKFRKANNLHSLVKNKTYSELKEDDSIDLNEYENEFVNCGFPFSFDELLKYMTKLDEDEIQQLVDEKNENELNNLKRKLEKANATLEKQKQDIVSLVSDKKKLEKEIKNRDKEIKKINDKSKQEIKDITASYENKIIDLEKMIDDNKKKNELLFSKLESSVSRVVGEDICGLTSEIILEKLTALENQLMKTNDLNKIKEVLAAKYATILYIEGAFDNE